MRHGTWILTMILILAESKSTVCIYIFFLTQANIYIYIYITRKNHSKFSAALSKKIMS